MLGLEDMATVPILRNHAKITEDSDAVFYFPGCGSERLFSSVGLASMAMMYELGTKVVLPPDIYAAVIPRLLLASTLRASGLQLKIEFFFIAWPIPSTIWIYAPWWSHAVPAWISCRGMSLKISSLVAA